MLLAHGATDKGRVRPVNADCFAFEPSHRLCVVADGMGGHKAGEVAARIAVDTIVEAVTTTEPDAWPFGFDPSLSNSGNRLRTAIHLAHMHVLEAPLELVLFQRALHDLDLETLGAEELERGGVDVLEQQDFDLLLRKAGGGRGVGHDRSQVRGGGSESRPRARAARSV